MLAGGNHPVRHTPPVSVCDPHRRAAALFRIVDRPANYAFFWEAYLRQYRPHVIAVARPHQATLVGEKVLLDASRSYSDSRIARFEWTFTDGGNATGQTVEQTYSQPGTYSEILK